MSLQVAVAAKGKAKPGEGGYSAAMHLDCLPEATIERFKQVTVWCGSSLTPPRTAPLSRPMYCHPPLLSPPCAEFLRPPPLLYRQSCLTGPEGRTAVQREVRAMMQTFFTRLRHVAQVREGGKGGRLGSCGACKFRSSEPYRGSVEVPSPLSLPLSRHFALLQACLSLMTPAPLTTTLARLPLAGPLRPSPPLPAGPATPL